MPTSHSTDIQDLRQRVADAEAIIRAQDRLIQSMYDGNSPVGSSISKKCAELGAAYEERYGANPWDGEQ